MFMIDLDTPSHYKMLGISPTATRDEIQTARDGAGERFRVASRETNDPEIKARLADEEQAVNSAGNALASPERRAEYDRENPDLRTLSVRSGAAPMFDEAAHRTEVLYRAIAEHLARRGARVSPPSDLYRTDFTADETPNHLLDELIAQRRR